MENAATDRVGKIFDVLISYFMVQFDSCPRLTAELRSPYLQILNIAVGKSNNDWQANFDSNTCKILLFYISALVAGLEFCSVITKVSNGKAYNSNM